MGSGWEEQAFKEFFKMSDIKAHASERDRSS